MTKPLQTVVRELQRQLITKEQENQDLRKKNTQLQTLNDALVEEHRELFQKAQDCEKEKQQLQNTINNPQNQLAQQNPNNNERNLRQLWQHTALTIAHWKINCQGHLDYLPWN